MTFVIIQHRSTESKSVMVSLLKKYTDLDVQEIEDNMRVEPETVYINPPHQDILIKNGRFHWETPADTYGVHLPIDHFFRSLGQDQAERAIGIVLSGTGTDGTLGVKAIKAAGGMAMVQQESQAKYSAMPRSALDTGLIDFVLPVEKMAAELKQYIKHPYLTSRREPLIGAEKFERALRDIFSLVHTITGHDFTNYKRNTIRRRIERRMAVHKLDDIKDYVRFLRENSGEVRTLFKDLTITVTNFFRDPEAFKSLREKVITEIIQNKPLQSPVRVWVPGCATGEEAYSIAMVLEETMSGLQKKHDVQVFATDIDEDAIETARYGMYTDSVAADISKERLERFFTEFDHSYKIKDLIREKLVFAKQDLIRDPPFSKLDLICCRNVLIYMGPELQRRIIPLFHYTLNPNGYLFLGTSETIGQFSDLFAPLDSRQKIFRRKSQGLKHYEHPAVPLSMESADGAMGQGQPPKQTMDLSQLAERLILREYSLPCVLVDDRFNIVYFNGDTGSFLIQPGGEPTTHILKMIRPELHYTLSVLLHKAEREEKVLTSEDMQIRLDSDVQTFKMVVRPIRESGVRQRLMLVVFDCKTKAERPAAAKAQDRQASGEGKTEPRVKALEQELASTKEYLQTTIEELETSNEELKSSNEELQSTNEELQSANEELETSREELQSTNEELRTVNSEHQTKIEELARANDDLNNLLASTNIATIFLDMDLNIKRFTPESKNLFKFIDTDMGRPLDNIVNTLEYEELEKDTRKVLDTLVKTEREVRTKDDTWLRVKIAPYRTTDNVIDGVVITAFDIGREKTAQNYAQSIVETIRQPLLVLDEGLKVVSVNPAFCGKFKVEASDTEGKRLYDLDNRQWDNPELRKLLADILLHDTFIQGFLIEHEFPAIGKRRMSLNARRVQWKGKGAEHILVSFEDITEPQ